MSSPAVRSPEGIRVGDVLIAPGHRTQVDLPIADLSIHVPITMPVHVINGATDGPVLFVSAAIHGDEINGVEIIRRIMKLAALRRLRGALIAVPIVNVPGFLNLSRYLPDRRDLNRSFPGSPRGSLAARLANMFLDHVLSVSTHGIDLHTGALYRENYPQIRVDLDDQAAEQMARAFGAPLVLNAGFRRGSLRGAANDLNIPVIVYEAGEALRFDEAAIRAGVRGVVRVMQSLDMLPARKRDGGSSASVILRSSSWVRAPSSGVVRAKHPIRHTDKDRGRTCRRFRSPGRGGYRYQVACGRRDIGPDQPAARTRRRRALPYRLDAGARASGKRPLGPAGGVDRVLAGIVVE